MGKPTINFGGYTSDQYKRVISSPSQSPVYFNRFHKPMVESLIAKFDAPIWLLSAACGFAHELEFLKDDKRVIMFGVDKSRKMISDAHKRIPNGYFMQADLAKSPPMAEKFHGAIAVNAMIYAACMEKIGTYMHKSLVKGGMAAMNFRDSRKPENIPFFEDCIRRGCQDIIVQLEVKGRHFPLRVMDFTSRQDTNRCLGQQAFFQNRRDMENFLALIGFEIASHGTYTYESSENKTNVCEVYSLAKPKK